MKITVAFLSELSKALNNEPSLRPYTLQMAEQLALFLLRLEHEERQQQNKLKQEEWR